MRREISASRLLELWNCGRQYIDGVTGKRDELTEFQVIGKATHMLAAGESPAQARQFVERKMVNRPEADRQTVMEKSVVMAATAERTKEPEVTADAIERQLVWRLENGWTVFAKPDRLFYFNERQPDGSELEVLEIDELKTSGRAKRWHWDQLFFFGTVASRVLDYHGPIKLVVIPLQYVARVIREKREELELTLEQLSARTGIDVKLLSDIEDSKTSLTDNQASRLARAFDMTPEEFDKMVNGGNEVMWYSQSYTFKTEQKVLETLTELEERWANRDFSETPGGHCFGCKSRSNCPIGQQWVAQRLAEQAQRQLELATASSAKLPEPDGGELPIVA